MANSFEKFQKRRLITSYFSVVLSITLVLFLLGILGLFILKAAKIEQYYKERIAMSVDFKNTAKDIEINQLQKSLRLATEVKAVVFTAKEEALALVNGENGEDIISFTGYNPFLDSIDIYFKSDYVSITDLEAFKDDLQAKNYIAEVAYPSDLVSKMNRNLKRISFWTLLVSGFFTLIAMLLINSSIRLAVYSKRFIIKTMQMVGATKRFIRRPFVWRSIRLGVFGAVLAIASLTIIAYYLDKNIAGLDLLGDYLLFGGLCLFIFGLGILITWVSTFFATQRFLNLKTDDLYY
jgi:cell division transport system permease protein